jgi:hypothetical protein
MLYINVFTKFFIDNQLERIMGDVSEEEEYILYAIGQCYKAFNKRFNNQPLEVSISKSIFIDIMISSHSVEKKERALYKNLEGLEKKKYLKYNNKMLSFTRKGLDAFERIDKRIKRFEELLVHLQNPKTIQLHKKLQTRFKEG